MKLLLPNMVGWGVNLGRGNRNNAVEIGLEATLHRSRVVIQETLPVDHHHN